MGGVGVVAGFALNCFVRESYATLDGLDDPGFLRPAVS